MRHSVCVARQRHSATGDAVTGQRDVRDEAMTHTSQDTESDRECAARAQVSQESQDIRWILIFVKGLVVVIISILAVSCFLLTSFSCRLSIYE